MRTKDEVVREHRAYRNLVNAIVRKIGGVRELKDVAEHGADSGFPGFTYYRETTDFFKRHKKDIVALVEEAASDVGQDAIPFVQSFRCLDAGEKEVAQTLYGNRYDYQVANALAWFALEEVSRWFCDD